MGQICFQRDAMGNDCCCGPAGDKLSNSQSQSTTPWMAFREREVGGVLQ